MSKRFYYPYTCPDIDKNIENFKDMINDSLFDIIRELCPIIEDTTMGRDFVKNWSEQIYKQSEDIFENVRDTNSKIRDEVDRVIDDVESELENAEQRIKELENEIYTLQS